MRSSQGCELQPCCRWPRRAGSAVTPHSWKSAGSPSGITMDDVSHHIILVDDEAQRALWGLLQLCPLPAQPTASPCCETHLACPWSCPHALAGKAVWTGAGPQLGDINGCGLWVLQSHLTLEGTQMVSQRTHGGGGMGARKGESLPNPGIVAAV